MSDEATVEIVHHFNPDHATLQHVSILFACPHLRIGHPAIVPSSQRAYLLSLLDTHDHYGNLDCTAELRRRYEIPQTGGQHR